MRKIHLSVALAALLGLYCGAAAAHNNEDTAADVVTGVVPLGAYALAYFKDDDLGQRQWLFNTGAELILNTAARGIFDQTSLGRRPNGNHYGFPSGHAGFVFSGAAFLQDRYGWQYGVPAYVLASAVAYERVDRHHHRARDVIAGAALSIGISKLFVTPENATHLAPVIGPDFLGMRWQRSF